MATQGPMGSYNFRRIRVVPEVVLPGWCAKLLCCFMLLYGWLTKKKPTANSPSCFRASSDPNSMAASMESSWLGPAPVVSLSHLGRSKAGLS